MEIFCKSIGSFYTFSSDLDFLIKVYLATVRLIGNTDYIRSIRQKFQVLGELLDSGHIHTAACSALKFLTQFFAGINAHNGFVSNVLFGCYKLL